MQARLDRAQPASGFNPWLRSYTKCVLNTLSLINLLLAGWVVSAWHFNAGR
jgi:hypothetical protein